MAVALFIEPNALPAVEPKRGWHGRFFHSEHMTFAYYDLDAGAGLQAHSHSNEEVWHIIAGDVELTVDGQTRVLSAGCAAIIPAGTTHGVTVKAPARAIVVDYPMRRELADIKI
jgi:quercetin dioxygenase-like cupin family protein